MGRIAAFSCHFQFLLLESHFSAALSSESGMVFLFPKSFGSLQSASFSGKRTHTYHESPNPVGWARGQDW